MEPIEITHYETDELGQPCAHSQCEDPGINQINIPGQAPLFLCDEHAWNLSVGIQAAIQGYFEKRSIHDA